MAPTRPMKLPDDSRSETSSAKDRGANLASSAPVNGRSRRAGTNLSTSTSARNVSNVSSAMATATAAVTGVSQEGNAGIQWASLDSSVLHSYRHAYRLNTPAAFQDPYNQLILSRPGIGRLSPTMVRSRDQRRQSKEQLATLIRKHFNGLGIQENDAVVEFLYKVKHQDKAFRLRFTPQKPR